MTDFDVWWIENSSSVCAGMKWTDNDQRAKVLDIARCAFEAGFNAAKLGVGAADVSRR